MRTLAFLFSSTLLLAQPVSNAPPTASDSGPFHMEMRLLNEHLFQQRELIQAEVTTSGQPAGDVRPRAEEWQFTGFLLDPAQDCGTVANPCYLRGGQMGGGYGPFGPHVLEGPYTNTVVLNSFMPDLPPGRYKVSVLARKLVLTSSSRSPMSSTYGYANPPEYVTSNAVDITVGTTTSQWISQTITSSATTLQTTPEGEASQNAARQLALLDSPAAWRAELDLLPRQESVLLPGLAQSSQPGLVCELMQSRIPAPEQSVSSNYLRTLLEVCSRANLPSPPQPAPTGRAVLSAQISLTPPPANPAPPNLELQAFFEKQGLYREELSNRSAAALAGALRQKQAEAERVTLGALIEYVSQLQYNRQPSPAPLWAPVVTGELVRLLPSLDTQSRRDLLSSYTSTFHTPELAPALEAILDGWKPRASSEEPRETLMALYRVDPKRAQARILQELGKSRTWLDAASLNLLQAEEVPPMDDELIASLAAAQKPGGSDANLRMTALARFGSAQALPRVRAIYESQQFPCQPELAAYFVRVDPAYASRMFQAAATPGCLVQYFEQTSALIMQPVLESFVASYLMRSEVRVKSTAAHALGKYGSATAEAPLWEAFRTFHEYFKGKGAELDKNGEGVVQEVELRNAIAHGRHWVATEPDLQTLESLCSSQRCLAEAQRDLQVWKQPLVIEIHSGVAGIAGFVAQYGGIETMADMEEKLDQFPQGTKFRLSVTGADRLEQTARILDLAGRKNFVISQ